MNSQQKAKAQRLAGLPADELVEKLGGYEEARKVVLFARYADVEEVCDSAEELYRGWPADLGEGVKEKLRTAYDSLWAARLAILEQTVGVRG